MRIGLQQRKCTHACEHDALHIYARLHASMMMPCIRVPAREHDDHARPACEHFALHARGKLSQCLEVYNRKPHGYITARFV